MRKIEISQCKKYGKGVEYYWQNYGNGIGHTIKTIANKQFHRQFKLGILYIAGQCDPLSAFVIIGLRKDKRWPVLAKLNQNLQQD